MASNLVSPLGVIPDNWELVTLREITTKIGSGATPRGGNEVYLPKREKFALVRSQNVFDRYFDASRVAFISDRHANELKNVWLEPGDILLNITGDGITFARASIVPEQILPACVNQHVSIIRVDPTKCLPGYILAYLTHPDIKHYIESFNAGGSRRAITKGHIESFVVPLPPLEEQRAIADILGSLDDKIEANRRMNETLEAIARAIFKSWFVDFDPVHYKARGEQPPGMDADTAALFPDSFEDSELGPIPSGWRVGTLGDIADNPRRSVQPKEVPSDTLYVGLEHIPRQSLALPEWGAVEDINSNKYQFKEGEILFGKLRPYFHKVVFAPISGICSTDILVIAPKDNGFYGLVIMHLSSEAVIEYATRVSTGTRMPRANWDSLSKYPIVLPSCELLKAFNSICFPGLNEIQVNVHQSRTLAQTRDALLPKLVSGEIRVGDIAKEF